MGGELHRFLCSSRMAQHQPHACGYSVACSMLSIHLLGEPTGRNERVLDDSDQHCIQMSRLDCIRKLAQPQPLSCQCDDDGSQLRRMGIRRRWFGRGRMIHCMDGKPRRLTCSSQVLRQQ